MKELLSAVCGLSLLSSVALAADPDDSSEVPLTEPVSSPWSGPYVGVYAGSARGSSSSSVTGYPSAGWATASPAVPASYGPALNGSVNGLQAGYNYRIDDFVLGIEADISAAHISGDAARGGTVSGSGTPFSFTESRHIESFRTLRGRIGYTPTDRLMIYGTAGVGQGNVTASTNLSFPTVSYVGSDSRSRVGWVVGAGAEYAIADHWTAKLEYLHYDLGRANVVGSRIPANATFNTQADFGLGGDIVRAGLNYQFGGPSASSSNTGANESSWRDAMQAEFGMRYWYSTGKTSKDIDNPAGTVLNSRLTYSDLTAHSGEFFFLADHAEGLFVKGYVGTGRIVKGNLHDEDFPPSITTYSSTSSNQRNGTISYASADVGVNFLTQPDYRLGAFVGVHYDRETVNVYGCTQTASGANCVPTIPDSTLAITNDARWYSARVGLAGDLRLDEKLRLAGDVAWLPYTRLDASDSHWLRIGMPGGFTGAIPGDGVGHNGFQLESTLTYLVSKTFSIGVGARYWRADTKGAEHYEGIAAGGVPQPLNYRMERYGSFLQAALKF